MGEGIIMPPSYVLPGKTVSMSVAPGSTIKKNEWVSKIASSTSFKKNTMYYYDPLFMGEISGGRYIIIYVNSSSSSGGTYYFDIDLVKVTSNGSLSVLSTKRIEQDISPYNVSGLKLNGDNYVITYMGRYQRVQHISIGSDNSITITLVHSNIYGDSTNEQGNLLIRGPGVDEYYFAILQGNISNSSSIGHGSGKSLLKVVTNLDYLSKYGGTITGLSYYGGNLYLLYYDGNKEYVVKINATSLSLVSKTQITYTGVSRINQSSADLGNGVVFVCEGAGSNTLSWRAFDFKSNSVIATGSIDGFSGSSMCIVDINGSKYISGYSSFNQGACVVVSYTTEISVSKKTVNLNATDSGYNGRSMLVQFEGSYFAICYSTTTSSNETYNVYYVPGVFGVVPYNGSDIAGISMSAGSTTVNVRVP